jgi:hypothetical protein
MENSESEYKVEIIEINYTVTNSFYLFSFLLLTKNLAINIQLYRLDERFMNKKDGCL